MSLGGHVSANTTGDGTTSPSTPLELPSWTPDAPATEPIHLIVSVPEQRVNVYAGGKLIAYSPVSTGREGNSTPTGVFSILEKKKFHRSNIYSNAPMPFMQRLTWSGIALHASDQVPNYPASHGCVRLPPAFAKKLFGFTAVGAHVIVSSRETTPVEISHSSLFQPVPLRVPVTAGTIAHRISDLVSLEGAPTYGAIAENIAFAGALNRSAGVIKPETPPLVAESFAEVSNPSDMGVEVEPTDAVRNRNVSPVRILVTRRTGRELVRDVQTLLKDLGFDPGKVDGWMGRDTGAAIGRFQESQGLQETGTMSSELAGQLYRAAGRGNPPSGHIYVRQDFVQVFDAPITISSPEEPLGNHLLTAMDFGEEADKTRWLSVTLGDGTSASLTSIPEGEATVLEQAPTSVGEALDRIEIPASVRRRISEMLTPGSSMAITDNGISPETVDKGTDFVVLTR